MCQSAELSVARASVLWLAYNDVVHYFHKHVYIADIKMGWDMKMQAAGFEWSPMMCYHSFAQTELFLTKLQICIENRLETPKSFWCGTFDTPSCSTTR